MADEKLPTIDESELSESGKAWRAWFDAVGDAATVKFINATATLVIAEREIYAGTGQAWLPIESAPKDGTPVLLFLSGEGYHGRRQCDVVVGVHTERGWYAISDGAGGVVSAEPSHWQPLPTAPGVEAARQ